MSNCQDNIHIVSLTIFDISIHFKKIVKISLYSEIIQKDIKIHIEPDQTSFAPLIPTDSCVGSLRGIVVLTFNESVNVGLTT